MSTVNTGLYSTGTIGGPSSSSVVGTANIAGVASGLNYNSIVSQLMAVEQNKITVLQNQQSAIATQQNLLTTLNGYLSTLQTQAQSLADSSNFLSYTTSLSSNTSTAASSLLSASASSSASTGTHTIVVNALAQAETLGSSKTAPVQDSTGATATSDTTALNLSGSFTITGANGTAQTVTVNTTDSLQNIIASINAQDTGSSATGVTASEINTGSGYQLVLTSDTTGATGFTTSLTSTTSSLYHLGFSSSTGTDTSTSIQAAQDANVTVDGYTVTGSTNTLSSAIPGVTLNLLQADTGTTVTMNVGVDTAAVTKNIQSFVDDYNKVMSFINQQMQFDTNTNTSGPLASDSVVSSIQSELSTAILQDIPGLSSSYNNMALIGVAPDSTGQLQIDSTTLNNALSSDPTAVEKIFSATGSSSNSALSFLTYGSGTVSGSYAVDITQAASQASVTGTTDLSTGLNLTGFTGSPTSETVTLTDGSQQQAQVTLNQGDSLSTIVSALNTEFAKTYTQEVKMSTALTASGSPANSSTTLASLGLGVQAGDTINITGTDRSGSAVNYTYTVSDPNTDTVGSILSAIQFAFNQQVTAGIDSNGNITLTDNSSGTSKLAFNLTANNEGGGTLNFGSESGVTTGRYAMSLNASASGNFLQLQDTNYGSGSSFTVQQSVDGLGIAGSTTSPYVTATGTDVAGTIGGLAATGAGQFLTGSTGNVSGLALLYTGSATGSIGTMTASLGVGATFDNLVNTYSDPTLGLVQGDINSLQTNYNDIGTNISDLQAQMNQEQATLLASFQSMESMISSMNVNSQFLTTATQMLAGAGSSSTSTGITSFK